MDENLIITSPVKYLKKLFRQSIEYAHPATLLRPYLPDITTKPVTIISAGKAAASLAKKFEDYWQGPISGIAVTPYGHGENTQFVKVIEASHPTPDKNSVLAAKEVFKLCSSLSPKDLVYVLLSGGGSSLLCFPEDNISLKDKQRMNVLLLKCGASIEEINTVRKQISKIKGGKLLSHCNGAQIHTLAISDVFNDDPSIIASGPSVPDRSSKEDVIKIINKYKLNIPKSIDDWLNTKIHALDKMNYSINKKNKYSIIASPEFMLKKIEKKIINDGYGCLNLGVLCEDSNLLGRQHARMSLAYKPDKPTIILSGGETTVKVTGKGQGGRNSQYLLCLAKELNGHPHIYALAADTDGIDGVTDAAGAYYYPNALKRLENDAKSYLDANDSYSAFKEINTLIKTGPTKTNVNDFRAILIAPNN